MKQLFLSIAVFGLVQLAQPSQAQVSVQVNLGIQPQWGPSGYDYAAYYYLPDIDVYYNVPRRQFVYFNGGRWVFAASLPGIYRDYDLYRGYKVVLNDDAPYRRCDYYRGQYGRYRGHYDRQVIIRDVHRPRYGYDRYERDRYDRNRYDRGRYDRDRYVRDRHDRGRYDRDRHDHHDKHDRDDRHDRGRH